MHSWYDLAANMAYDRAGGRVIGDIEIAQMATGVVHRQQFGVKMTGIGIEAIAELALRARVCDIGSQMGAQGSHEHGMCVNIRQLM